MTELTTTRNEKQLFAVAMLKPGADPYAVALEVFGGDIPKALIASRQWPSDPEVLEYREIALEDNGAEAYLPSKAEVVTEIWTKAKATLNADTAFKGFKLVADIMGYVDKPGTTVNNNTLVDNRKVMVVKDHGTDDEWEAKLQQQQADLVNVSAQPATN